MDLNTNNKKNNNYCKVKVSKKILKRYSIYQMTTLLTKTVSCYKYNEFILGGYRKVSYCIIMVNLNTLKVKMISFKI